MNQPLDYKKLYPAHLQKALEENEIVCADLEATRAELWAIVPTADKRRDFYYKLAHDLFDGADTPSANEKALEKALDRIYEIVHT
ncbi:MAG: hypothetical protein L0Z53_20725 [Acidobacteriales bacterium]|nr:hypothetical protein [Terriglobales bacterium]